MFNQKKKVQSMINSLCNCTAKNLSPSYHKLGCPVRKGIKFPRLFYCEEGYDCLTPVPRDIENIVDVQSLDVGETVCIEFKRLDLTDQEIKNLPDM